MRWPLTRGTVTDMDEATLRALVREVITAEIDRARKDGATVQPVGEQRVRIVDDADLGAFAAHVVRLAEDADVRRAILAGTQPFRLDRAGGGGSPATNRREAAPAGGGTARVETGVVTERVLDRLPRGTTTLYVGPGVSITPLARDRARHLRITIERVRT